MFGLFNYDSPLNQLLSKITDCLCLSLLWLICAVPVVTIGPATTALYYATNKCIRRSEGGIWKSYWYAFRLNFKQALGLWLILLILYGLLTACCYSAYLLYSSGLFPKEMLYFLLLVTAIVTCWAGFLFPYLARFQNSTRQVLKNCMYFAIMHFPISLVNLVWILICAVAVMYFPLAIICVPGLYMVLSCYMLESVFKKYMSQEDRAREEILDSKSCEDVNT